MVTKEEAQQALNAAQQKFNELINSTTFRNYQIAVEDATLFRENVVDKGNLEVVDNILRYKNNGQPVGENQICLLEYLMSKQNLPYHYNPVATVMAYNNEYEESHGFLPGNNNVIQIRMQNMRNQNEN